MGHQLNFYLTPEDTRAVELRLRERGPLTIVHTRSASSSPTVLESLDHREGGKPWLFYALVRPQDLARLRMRFVRAQSYWAVDVLESPVVEFTGCFFDGHVLRRGRVFYEDGFYSGESWVDKGEDFKGWATGVMGAVRRGLRRHKKDYIGADAAAWLAESGGKLVQ